nr:P-type conjugative transfer protein TrbL [uncultured bacterium]
MFAAQAQAATATSAGLLDDILDRFEKVASTWGASMVSYATWLFWGLVLISMVWTYGMMVLRKADIGEFFAETMRFLATTGFFWWILKNGPAISTAIIDTLRQISAKATGLGNTLSPSSIVDIGFDIAGKVVDNSSVWSPVNSGVGIIIAAVILVVLALVGVNMLLLLVSGWLLAYGAVFLLGFGGGRWTSDIAIAYYKTVLGIAVQLFAMILIVGVGKSFIDQYYAATTTGAITMKSLLVMLVASVVLLMLVAKVPPMFAGIVGGPSSAGIGGFGAGAAVGAAAAAAGVAAGLASAGASMALGGAANLAGAGNALQAAFQSAQANMGGGGGDTGSAGSDGGDTGSVGGSEGGGGGGGGGSSGGGSSFGQAMGTAGRFAADMGGSLLGGAKSGLSAKASSIAAAANERIGNTVGGKLAAEINGSAGQARADAQTMERAGEIKQGQDLQEARNLVAQHDSPAPATEPEFDGDSLASGRPDVDAFVNGKA